MRQIAAVLASILLASPSLLAEAPPSEVRISPRIEGRFNFSVVLSARGAARLFNVFAPPRINGDCTPSWSGSELRAKDGRLIYSQTSDLAPSKSGPEFRGRFEDPSQVLVLWITYFCPNAVGTRFTFSSSDWEKAGLLQ